MRRWPLSIAAAHARCGAPKSQASSVARPRYHSALAHAQQRSARSTSSPALSANNAAAQSAKNANATSSSSSPGAGDASVITGPSTSVDPYTLLAPELTRLRTTLLRLLGSSHPSLTQIAEYYFLQPAKQIRPLLVLLFSHATNGLGKEWDRKRWAAEQEGERGRTEELDSPLSRPDVLNDWNPNMPEHTHSFSSVFELSPLRNASPLSEYTPPLSHTSPSYLSSSSLENGVSTVSASMQLHSPPLTSFLLPTQLRLAQVVEMIHVASLLHDDVIDGAALRRSAPSAPSAFGNKLAVLAGDFLLGRASAALSRLGSAEVVELISSVIANLVEGEILQMRSAIESSATGDEAVATLGEFGMRELGLSGGSKNTDRPSSALEMPTGMGQEMWNVYLKKSYLKTASLIAKSARAAVVLGGVCEGEIWKEVAYAYGRNIGIAFQLVDDVLDYEAADSQLGKPGGADLQLGLATGPALFAWEEHSGMGPLIARKFDQDGDVELARDLVRRSSGVERTRALAQAYADKAREVLELLPDSDARRALDALAVRVVKRKS